MRKDIQHPHRVAHQECVRLFSKASFTFLLALIFRALFQIVTTLLLEILQLPKHFHGHHVPFVLVPGYSFSSNSFLFLLSVFPFPSLQPCVPWPLLFPITPFKPFLSGHLAPFWASIPCSSAGVVGCPPGRGQGHGTDIDPFLEGKHCLGQARSPSSELHGAGSSPSPCDRWAETSFFPVLSFPSDEARASNRNSCY